MKNKKYKTNNLPPYSNTNKEDGKESYTKHNYQLIIDEDSVYEIDEECINCLKKNNMSDFNK